MTGPGRDEEPAGSPAGSVSVLAGRIAASLVHHEPGWRLPRTTALARRYNVSVGQVEAAISSLAARNLVRRLPDGQIYRTSPAEYRISLDGLFRLSAQVDPMGGRLACQRRQSMWRRPPAGIGRSLGLADGAQTLVTRCLWTVGGEPAALAASFLAEGLAVSLGVVPAGPAPEGAGPATEDRTPADAAPVRTTPMAGGNDGAPASLLWPWRPPPDLPVRARALQIELALPAPSVARSLWLPPTETVITVTASLAEPPGGAPLAVTRSVLRAGLFRVLLDTGGAEDGGAGAGLPTAWTRAAEDWEP